MALNASFFVLTSALYPLATLQQLYSEVEEGCWSVPGGDGEAGLHLLGSEPGVWELEIAEGVWAVVSFHHSSR